MPHPVAKPLIPRAYHCRCGRPVFFRNSECLACHTALGYDPVRRLLLPVEPLTGEAGAPGLWRAVGGRRGTRRYRRCSHLASPAACNWLVEATDRHAGTPPLCRCCRLTRMLPDLSQPENKVYWLRIARDQRRLVSTLIGLGLPVQSRASEDPKQGLAFDLLRAAPGGPPVVTGHADGVITLDVEEADDARREQRRSALHEPYRTLLGHLRHESGHYYWQRLVLPGRWLEPFRALFGDERQDYAGALQAHYQHGAPADWATRHVSAYASSHPWEDWAETWAHYLHLRDTLDTARSFGLDGESVELNYERFGLEALGEGGAGDAGAPAFLALVNGWMELTGVLNELSRSMGVPDFYPFVLSAAALRKLHLVHRVVGAPLAAPA
ncbi:zinc-binding metallopeptidase family protein [Ideonella sp.]|uniref:zinc-binding metallopeptidase family protein n=1 Tax=Ideonella sp. TaxID=1929293 RepID=UPI002B463B94|nr:putative zinc-binding metallopeptidase [Ideonella sp.]HJV70756.1 putative zinc-binding metallopeptidase [Ideonella sp.]